MAKPWMAKPWMAKPWMAKPWMAKPWMTKPQIPMRLAATEPAIRSYRLVLFQRYWFASFLCSNHAFVTRFAAD